MPQLPIGELDRLTGIDSAIVQAHMFWPRDEELRRALILSEWREVAISMLERGEDPAALFPRGSIADRRRRLAEILRADRQDALCDSFNQTNGWHNGSLAGLRLFYLHAVSKSRPDLATMGRSRRVAMAWAKQSGQAASRETVNNAWRLYQPVSHLWAADFLFATQGIDWIDLDASDILPVFLAMADQYRRFGEDFVTPGHNGTNPIPVGKAWTAPGHVALPDVELPDAALTDWVIAAAEDKSIAAT